MKIQNIKPASGIADPLPPVVVRDPFTITILGATGDLTYRKLIPALYALYSEGLLPKAYKIIGFARRDYDDVSFQAHMEKALREHSRIDIDEKLISDFIANVHYHKGDLSDPSAYEALKNRIVQSGFPENHIAYLAIRPDLFGESTTQLHRAGLISPAHGKPWTRVVIEKPFGSDFGSAQSLNRSLLQSLDESQIYRIDHYLGKETVQNILSFRFANSIFEPLFNNHHVDHIQITAGETVGMESGRGAYYDTAGAMRDMVQNHILQLLCLVCMEPPSNLTADSIRNEKVELLRCVRQMTPGEARSNSVRAQYAAGTINGEGRLGYREEDRVNPESSTACFVALKLNIENWRWAGVPIYLRTGKRLPMRFTEIAIQFKMPPLQLFKTVECEGDVCDLTNAQPNTLVFRIQPDAGIQLTFSAKRPAMQLLVESVEMDFSYRDTWGKSLPEAYERLLMDVMRGDSTNFTRSDEVEAAWNIVDPILDAWSKTGEPSMATYAAGSWGPKEANKLLSGEHRRWQNPALPE